MNYQNLHERIAENQWVYWSDLPLFKAFDFELVDFFKAPVVRKGRGVYMVYYALARSDIPEISIKIGDSILLHITYLAYLGATNKLPNEQRVPAMKKFAEGKNLLIRIEKLNSKSIKIHSQQVVVPTEEQLAEAQKQYDMLKDFK